MAYLRVENFWKYQNADVWKKSKTHPPWFKHYVHRDRELDQLPYAARLLFWELVAAATRYSNVLQDDLNWIYAETRIELDDIRETLPLLLKGGWLSETKTTRRSRKHSRKNLDDPLDQDVDKEEDKEEDLNLGFGIRHDESPAVDQLQVRRLLKQQFPDFDFTHTEGAA